MGRSAWVYAGCAWVLVSIVTASVHAQPAQEMPPPAAASEVPAPATSEAEPRRMPWRESKERLPPAEEAPQTERIWYGWQTLVCDFVAISVVVIGSDEVAPVVVGLSLFGVASPIVHVVHQNYENGFISFGIRGASIGLFFLGGYLIAGSIFDGGARSVPIGVTSIILSLTGALAAVLTDATLLAFETKPRKPSEPSASLVPLVDPKRATYGLQVALAL